MDLITLDKKQKNLLQIMQHVESTNLAVSSAITTLNNGYQFLWTLPDNELLDVLQELLNSGNFMSLFGNHQFTAQSLNSIQDRTGFVGTKAFDVAGREFIIDENGVVSFPVPEPVIEEL